MIFLCALIACVLGSDIDFIDGFDDALSPNKTEVRQGFEYLRTNFNQRINKIITKSGMSDVNFIMEYRRKWFHSIVTVVFSSTSNVVANSHEDRLYYKKRQMSSDEIEKVEAFLASKWAYRYSGTHFVYDKILIYVFYVEGGRVVSVQCYDQPILNAESKRRSLGGRSFVSRNGFIRSDNKMMGEDLSAIAYDKFVDVVGVFRPLVTDLQLEIRSR